MRTPDSSPQALLDADLLRTFTAIVDHGSFNRAARAVFRTPSAVSMQMKRLEETLERSLFDRSGRAIELTPDGETLLGYARRILRLNEEALQHFRAPPLAGVVRFGAPDDFGTNFLPDMLLRFSRTHPRVQVDVRLGTTQALESEFANGSLDVTLVITQDQKQTEGQVVHREALLWTGLQGGNAFRRRPLPLALATHGCAWRRLALEALDAAGVAYNICYTSDHSAGQQAAMLSDLAIAPFPASLISPPLEVLPQETGLPPIGHYHVVLVRGAQPSVATQALCGHVAASFMQLRPASAAGAFG